jgi:hypothetical protein
MERRADFLRFIAVRLRRPELRDVVRQPGVSAAYRITIHYDEGQYADQIATLVHGQGGAAVLEVAYRRAHQHPTFEFPFGAERYQAFDLAMRRLGFDRLDDQPDVVFPGTDLWLIERASGSYLHDVVLAPALAQGVYGWLVDTVRKHVREALRPIRSE